MEYRNSNTLNYKVLYCKLSVFVYAQSLYKTGIYESFTRNVECRCYNHLNNISSNQDVRLISWFSNSAQKLITCDLFSIL